MVSATIQFSRIKSETNLKLDPKYNVYIIQFSGTFPHYRV